MKKLILSILVLTSSMIGFSQLEVTLEGSINDPNFLKQKKALEAKGFTVKMKGEEKDVILSEGEQFVEKWTNAQIPTFSISDLNEIVISSEDIKGKFVHINFWSVTCKPCIEEFSELNELKKKYGDQLVFIAIAPESNEKVNRILKNNPLDYIVAGNSKLLFEELGVGGYPKNFFINPDGKIMMVTDGTHYKMEEKNGKNVMVPDNFKIYDEIIAEMLDSE